jgi:hypothetical protein
MKTQIVTLTPEMAADLLSRNTYNRPLSEFTLSRYVAAIKRGEWELNGESIIVFKNGSLGDGQHRCHAVIKAKMPITTVLVTDVEPSAFKTIDVGKTRSAADAIAIHGEVNSKVLAAGARSYLQEYMVAREFRELSTSQLIACIDSHPHIRHWAKRYAANKQFKKVMPNMAVGIFAVASERHGIEKLDYFFESVASGVNLTNRSPAYLLRERFLSQRGSQRLSGTMQRAFIVKAINAHLQNKEIAFLRFSEAVEEMPKIL